MKIALALAVIVGMGFAGFKIAQSGDMKETTQRLDAQLLDGVNSVRSLLGSPFASHPTELAESEPVGESLQPGLDSVEVEPDGVSYIARTGGVGVALRSSCRADARLPGGFAEGSRVEVVERGGDACQGWSLVRSGNIESWVHDQYLGDDGQRTLASSQADS